MILTKQQLLATSQDETNTERARQCANPWRWDNLEGNERAIWGEYKTPSKPFLAAVDLNGPGFKCSCPSRKFPCKHALGLGLLLFENNGAFKVGDNIPESIESWLEKRDKRATQTDTNPETTVIANGTEEPVPPQKVWNAFTITTEKRIEEMKAGIEELQIWLEDLMREGIASLEAQGRDRLFNISTRMVDAKLGSIGKRLRALIPILGQDNWHEQVMASIGEIYLLISGLKKLESLPPLYQTEILMLAGVNLKKDDLLTETGVWDIWEVMGVQIEKEEQLTVRRTWLMGENTGETALLLDFVFGGAGFENHWKIGEFFEGELVFYPSVFPQRAILKSKEGVPLERPVINGFLTIEKFEKAVSAIIAKNPWASNLPAFLEKVIPVYKDENWFLADKTGAAIPMKNKELMGWKMLAISGGEPIKVFGEWRDGTLSPMSWEN